MDLGSENFEKWLRKVTGGVRYLCGYAVYKRPLKSAVEFEGLQGNKVTNIINILSYSKNMFFYKLKLSE